MDSRFKGNQRQLCSSAKGEGPNGKLLACSRCHGNTHYCSKQCQRAGWRRHREGCDGHKKSEEVNDTFNIAYPTDQRFGEDCVKMLDDIHLELMAIGRTALRVGRADSLIESQLVKVGFHYTGDQNRPLMERFTFKKAEVVSFSDELAWLSAQPNTEIQVDQLRRAIADRASNTLPMRSKLAGVWYTFIAVVFADVMLDAHTMGWREQSVNINVRHDQLHFFRPDINGPLNNDWRDLFRRIFPLAGTRQMYEVCRDEFLSCGDPVAARRFVLETEGQNKSVLKERGITPLR